MSESVTKHAGKKRKHSTSTTKLESRKRHKHHKSDKQENDDSENEEDADTKSNADHEDKRTHRRQVELIADSAEKRDICGDSPSHFTYFGEDEGVFIAEKGACSPLWSRGDPRLNQLDNYLESAAKVFYHPIEAMDAHLSIHKNKKNKNRQKKSNNDNNNNDNDNNDEDDDEADSSTQQSNIYRYSSLDLLLSPLRKRSPLDEWSPREIALFESAMLSKGKQFHEISKLIGTKNTKECVQFYYHWKQSSHYAVWKALGRQTSNQVRKSHAKLHKKIGQKFAEFHDRHARQLQLQSQQVQQQEQQQQEQQQQQLNRNSNATQSIVMPVAHSVRNDIQNMQQQQQQQQQQPFFGLDANSISMLQPTSHNPHDAAWLCSSSEQQSEQTAADANAHGGNGAYLYVPTYYANGYPTWYTNAPSYYQQFVAEQQQQQMKEQQQPNQAVEQSAENNNSNTQTSDTQKKNLCIDLTEYASSNGSGSPKNVNASYNGKSRSKTQNDETNGSHGKNKKKKKKKNKESHDADEDEITNQGE